MAHRVLIIGRDEVVRLLPMGECIDVMAETLAAMARGEALLPLRTIVWLPDGSGALAAMPGYAAGTMGAKVITVFPANEGTDLDAHQGVVLLFERDRGRLVAIADATEITAIRTGAVSGAATRALAREDAGDLAILGSGTQARSHLDAMLAVRDIRRVRVWSRTAEHAQQFADAAGRQHEIEIEIVRSAQGAVRDADLICTTTSTREPILEGDWLSPGSHVNAAGFSGPTGRELDTGAVVRSRLFVDRRESALNEAGDVVIPTTEGAISENHIAGELGDVLAGTVPGRKSPDEITLFESVGLAIEDVAAVDHVYRRALETGAGIPIDLGGRRRPG